MFDIKFTLLDQHGDKIYTNIFLNVGDYDIVRVGADSSLLLYKHLNDDQPFNKFVLSGSCSYELTIIQERTPPDEEFLSLYHIQEP
jgi:hypothetical protein